MNKKSFLKRLSYSALLSCFMATTVFSSAQASLPTLGDPTLDSFSSRE
jgi:hypothetical protein